MGVLADLVAAWRWRDFARMGVGIGSRYERCRLWWQPHLSLTSTYISDNMAPDGKVAILGAGRLLDVNLPALLAKSREVHLFDCDPTAARTWGSAIPVGESHRVIFRLEDVTDCIHSWTRALASRHSRNHMSKILSNLEAPQPAWSKEGFDTVVSLNVLGQIPLYWRDRVLSSVRRPDREIYAAMESAMAKLQVAHVRGLVESGAERSLAITDTEYYYYTCEKSNWRVEPALFGDAAKAWNEYGCSGMRDAWLWHLAPQFVESDDYGEIHRVEAKTMSAALNSAIPGESRAFP